MTLSNSLKKFNYENITMIKFTDDGDCLAQCMMYTRPLSTAIKRGRLLQLTSPRSKGAKPLYKVAFISEFCDTVIIILGNVQTSLFIQCNIMLAC